MPRESARNTFVLGPEPTAAFRAANRTHAYHQPKGVNEDKEGPHERQIDWNRCKPRPRRREEAEGNKHGDTKRYQGQGPIILLHEHFSLYETRIGLPIVEAP